MPLPAGVDPRQPVIIGVSQILVDRDVASPEPAQLMAEAVRLAVADTGADRVLGAVDVVACVPVVSWRYQDPARLVAAELGIEPKNRWYPAMGGNTPQMLVNRGACAIADGDADVVAVCGAEAYRTRQTTKRETGSNPRWTRQDDTELPTWGDAQKLDMGHPIELARGILLPTQCYPLFENALRHEAGRTAEEHSRFIAELWAGFSAVASKNPFAVDRTAYTAEEIATVTPDNRMVGFPYTKHMVSNPDLDAATGLVMCSAEKADSLGVPRDRWVFPWSGTDGHEPYLSFRPDFTSSAAMRVAGRAALELAGVDADDVDHIDLYSCFPSAVELAADAIGIAMDRPLTVYGGLCFAGGPWNNPVGHAIATMAGLLRGNLGAKGLVTANGGNVQKHAFAVYSADPPPSGWRYSHPQFAIDALNVPRDASDEVTGAVTIETWTVMHERDGSASRAHAAVVDAQGTRSWGVTSDPEVMAAMEVDDFVGVAATRDAEATLRF